MTPSTQNSASNAAKHDAILEAACQCFAEQGFAQTRISDIAKIAGIGKGTVYEYVRSKEDLLLEACLWSCDRNDQLMHIHLAGDEQKVVGSDGQPLKQWEGHPVRVAFEVLRSVLSVVLAQSISDNRMFSELQSVCQQRPDLMQKTRDRLGSKLSGWMDTAYQLGKQGMAAGFFRDIPDEHYRWCARLVVAAVDGLIWQRCFLAEDDIDHTAQHIAAAWVRLHLKQPELLERYLDDHTTTD